MEAYACSISVAEKSLLEREEGNRCSHGLVLWLQKKTGNISLTTGLGRGMYFFTVPTSPAHQTAFVRFYLI